MRIKKKKVFNFLIYISQLFKYNLYTCMILNFNEKKLNEKKLPKLFIIKKKY